MRYYEVWVASQRYHGKAGLTYSSDEDLAVGCIVLVPLQKRTVAAVIIRKVAKPQFATKGLLRSIPEGLLPLELLKLVDWIRGYYPAPFGQIMSLILPTMLTRQSRKQTEPTRKKASRTQPPLTDNQEQAVRLIDSHTPKSIILHGDTGTGKTRVYTELIAKTLDNNTSALLLTPEIGLTPQLATAMNDLFAGRTVVLHSEQTPAARRSAWLKALSSDEPLVIIGPRSALFAPIHTLGLIILDEFHEGAYKQEQAPHYQASRVAAKLAEFHKAQLILGSATPPIMDYYTFEQKKLPIIRMDEQAKKHAQAKPDVVIIDLKKRELFNRSAWISGPLLMAIGDALEQKQQTLIFLNRRGTARLILCQVCGWEALCPRCDLPLTYHGDKHIATCHTCGYWEKSPLSCPECSSNDIIFRSIGTKSLVNELEQIFPKARIQRFDSDNTKAESLEQNFTSVASGDIDILVGTQMLGKGLDLPKLSVLGIIQADTSLSFPDYTSEERTYQLITQALGRINRGHLPGTAFVQTYHPNNQLLLAATQNDFQTFYAQQIEERRLYHFPPFRFMLKLTCTRSSVSSAKQASEKLALQLKSHRGIEVIGPSPAFTEKTHNQYRWQLIIKANQRPLLTEIIKQLPNNWSYDIDPMNLL